MGDETETAATYAEWKQQVPQVSRGDALWKMEAYRLGLFLSDLAWHDANKLVKDRLTVEIADQLYRAIGKISSNIGEGYWRNIGKDRARFYEYAMGSAREARDWYYKSRHVLDSDVVAHRLDLAAQVVRLTVTMTARERRINRKFAQETAD